jgi:hypothetical protein
MTRMLPRLEKGKPTRSPRISTRDFLDGARAVRRGQCVVSGRLSLPARASPRLCERHGAGGEVAACFRQARFLWRARPHGQRAFPLPR